MPSPGLRIQGSGFQGPGFWDPDSGFRVQGSGFQGSGFGFRVEEDDRPRVCEHREARRDVEDPALLGEGEGEGESEGWSTEKLAVMSKTPRSWARV